MNWTQVYEFVRAFMNLDPERKGLERHSDLLPYKNLLAFLIADWETRAMPEGLKDLCKGPLCQLLVTDGYESLIALRPETIACVDELEQRAKKETVARRQKACEALWKEEDRLLEMLDGYHTVAAGPAAIAPGLLRLLEAASEQQA